MCSSCPKGSICPGGALTSESQPQAQECPEFMTTLGIRSTSLVQCGEPHSNLCCAALRSQLAAVPLRHPCVQTEGTFTHTRDCSSPAHAVSSLLSLRTHHAAWPSLPVPQNHPQTPQNPRPQSTSLATTSSPPTPPAAAPQQHPALPTPGAAACGSSGSACPASQGSPQAASLEPPLQLPAVSGPLSVIAV